MKIYTKTGDDGTTGLVGGSRIRKDDVRVEAVGAVDELNAALGLAIVSGLPEPLASILHDVQCRLFDIGAELATPPDSKFNNASLPEADIRALEVSIDLQTEDLPTLRNFILPGGSEQAARLHFARTLCRRAERSVLRIEPSPRADVLCYLNRLSDWLFVAARTTNAHLNVEDIKWTAQQEK